MVSPKEPLKWPFAKPIGRIRLSGRELIDLFRKYSSSDVTISAETNSHHFDSIEDMEENLSLLQGDTKVAICFGASYGPRFIVQFGYCTNIDSIYITEEGEGSQKALRQRLEADLRSLRTPVIWLFSLIPRFVWWGGTLGLTLGSGLQLKDWPQNPFGLDLNLANFFFAMFAMSLLLGFVKPVYFARTDTFWMRNKDKILIGVLMLTIGFLLSEFGPNFLTLGQP